MVIALDDDLAKCTDFDVAAVFATTPTATTISGTFRDPTDAVFVGGQLEIEAMDPTFEIRTALMTAGIIQGLSVTVQGGTYTVRRIQKTAVGITVLYLKTT
jgi:hypothetical protein